MLVRLPNHGKARSFANAPCLLRYAGRCSWPHSACWQRSAFPLPYFYSGAWDADLNAASITFAAFALYAAARAEMRNSNSLLKLNSRFSAEAINFSMLDS